MQSFWLGPFFVEPSKGSISRGENIVTIEPKAMAVLWQLKLKQGEVVSQQSLFEHVWPGRIFSPSSLQRVIAIIRKALDETSQNPTYLFTHPKLGYRLEVPKQAVPQQAGSEPLEASGAVNEEVSGLASGIEIVKTEAEKIPAVSFKSKVAAGLLVFAFVFTILFGPEHTFFSNQTSSVTPLTFGQQAQFNGKVSNNGELIAYQSEGERYRIYVTERVAPSNVQYISFERPVIDYVWRSGEILVLTKEASGFALHQVEPLAEHQKQIAEHQKQRLTGLTFWHDISQLLLSDSSTLWFIGEFDPEDKSYLVRYDLVSGTHVNMLELPQTMVHASITASDDALYFHFFDGKAASFGLINRLGQVDGQVEGQIEYLDMEPPDIADIHWHHDKSLLLVSNQLAAELYALKNGELVSLPLPVEDILQDFSSADSLIVATQSRQDMDVTRLQAERDTRPDEIKLVDTKFSDYLATYSAKNDLAFLSTRNGRPQVFIQEQNKLTLAFENPKNIQYIPPLVWSPAGDKLAIVLDGQLHVLDLKSKSLKAYEFDGDIERISSWSQPNKLVAKANGEYVDLSFLDTELVQLAIDQIDTLDKVDYAARDSQGQLLTIKEGTITWAEKRIEFTHPIRFAFYHQDHLVVQAETEPETETEMEREQANKVIIFNRQLQAVYSRQLPSECHYVSTIEIQDNANTALICTQLTAFDSDIVLIENLAF